MAILGDSTLDRTDGFDERGFDELLSRVATGDTEAFGHLYDGVSPQVLGLVLTVVPQVPQAEAIAREVFLHVWQTAPRFDSTRESALGWVLRVAHAWALVYVRRPEFSGTATDAVELVG